MSKLNYKTSKDYKRLKELLDKGEEVIVIYEAYDFVRRQQVMAFIAHKSTGFVFGSYYYLGAFSWNKDHEESFEKCCWKTNDA